MSKEKQKKNEIEPVESEVLQDSAQTDSQQEAVEQENVTDITTESQQEAVEQENVTDIATDSQQEAVEQENVTDIATEEDDPTSVKLTILVLCTDNDNDGTLLRMALRSLQNIRGIDAEVKVTGRNKPTWLPHEDFISIEHTAENTDNDIIREALVYVKDARIILMTDRMIIANPITLADIALLKALPDGKNDTIDVLKSTGIDNAHNYAVDMPLYAFREQLLRLMVIAHEHGIKNYDIATLYNNAIFPDIKPIYVYWRNDSWVVPIVKASPVKADVIKYAKKKKFIYCKSSTPQVLEVISSLFPTPSPCELTNEDKA